MPLKIKNRNYMTSDPGPSTPATPNRIRGYPLKLTKSVSIPARSQGLVNAHFEPTSVRPATDYVVESTSKAIAQYGLMTSKALIDGRQSSAVLAIVNATLTTTRLKKGSTVAWAFPLAQDDEVTPSIGPKGKPDTMPFRKPKVDLAPTATPTKSKKKVRFIHSVAIDDETTFDNVKMGTDPDLSAADSDCEPDEQASFEKYQIREPTLNRKQKKQLLEVLKDNDKVFAKSEYDLGCCNVAEHHIDTGEARPIHCNPHAMPHHLRPVLRTELDDMIERDFIEPSRSSWAAPIVYVRKKDGSWRLCVDFRKLNQVAKICVYPLPRIQDIFSTLEGSRYFSSLDLAKGFWQIKLDEDSKEKTAFTTIFGLFQFKRLPMGLATAPGAFQEAMATVLAGLNWVHAMVYLDDILIFAPTFEEHLKILRDVFERLEGAGLKVKLSKCEFARTELRYLGHVLNSKGIRPDEGKVAAVQSFPPPRNLKELETFLGKAGYYCRFIKNFSKIAYPLFKLKKKDAEWIFGEVELEAFETLKKCLCEAPVLRFPDLDRPFTVQTDASGYGLGAVLTQHFEDGEHPIAYASRTIKDAETRYSTIEKEALGIFWGVKHFEQYLHGTHFIVLTDHKPLESLMKKQWSNSRLQNYALKLQQFDLTITYREGAANANADTLSRYPCIPLRSQKTKKNQCDLGSERLETRAERKKALALQALQAAAVEEERAAKLEEIVSEGERANALLVFLIQRKAWKERPAVLVTPTRLNAPSQPNLSQTSGTQEATIPWYLGKTTLEGSSNMWGRLRHDQQEDPFLGPVLEYIRHGQLPQDAHLTAIVLKVSSDFVLTKANVLARSSPHWKSHIVACIPKNLTHLAVEIAHDAPWAGHQGIKGTIRRAQQYFWWPRLSSDCQEFVRKCALCARYKQYSRHPICPLGKVAVPNRIWQTMCMDHWSVGLAEDGTSKGVLAFIDVFSKYLILEPVGEYTSAETVRVFMTKVAAVYGLPDKLRSDGGPGFVAALSKALFRAVGVSREICVPYRPQSNGQIERVFHTLRPTLASLCHEYPRKWPEMLPHVAFAYNTAYHRAIDNTPFYVMFGRDPTFRMGPLEGNFVDDEENTRSAHNEMIGIRTKIRQKLREQRKAYKDQYDQNVAQYYKNREFSEGQVIWALAETVVGDVAKLAQKYVGPYRIVKMRGPNVLSIVPLAHPRRKPKTIHIDKAKPCLDPLIDGDENEDLLEAPFTPPVAATLDAEQTP